MERDYTAPTPDMPNVQLLPEVMQVRDFGKRSQTKWKHLAAEDTSSVSVYYYIIDYCYCNYS